MFAAEPEPQQAGLWYRHPEQIAYLRGVFGIIPEFWLCGLPAQGLTLWPGPSPGHQGLEL